MSTSEHRTLSIKVPDKLNNRGKRHHHESEHKAANMQHYPLYYESESFTEEEYAKKHAKFVRKTEPTVAQAYDNLVDALTFLREYGAKSVSSTAE